MNDQPTTPPAPHPVTELTIVLGPPSAPNADFAEFQAHAASGGAVADHVWAHHEYAALDALTHRDGPIANHTLIETMVGGVLQVPVLFADVDRQWVRHADGQLYASLTIASADVRPRAAALALHDPALVEALNGLASTISALDGREWIAWSSRTWHDEGRDEVLTRAARLVGDMATLVITDSPFGDAPAEGDAPVPLLDELLVAIRHGRAHAERPTAAITRELRTLRHLDPMRAEWARITMDAFYLAALDPSSLRERMGQGDAAGLAYLFLGTERTERLKVNPELTPRFRGEIAAKTFMTAYALERLAPMQSRLLHEVMGVPQVLS